MSAAPSTVADLRRVIADLPDDAPIFAYVGPEGIKVTAEPPTRLTVTIISAPSAVPLAGGHAVVLS